MAEVENVLNIHASALNWPIGTGRDFQGIYDRQTNECILFEKASTGGSQKAVLHRHKLDSPEIKNLLPQEQLTTLQDELDLLEMAGNPFKLEDFLAGKVTPVFFASALTNFGIEPFFDAFIELAPPPQKRKVDLSDGSEKSIDPAAEEFSGYVFKLQANMDKRHRDSMAFLRICSGRFDRDLVVKHHRLGREIRLSRPHGMVAGERATLDSAYAGDIIGVINPGVFAIGDTVSLNGGFNFKPLPQFQPEIFAKLQPKDISKRKAFDRGILQLAEEGAIQVLRPLDGYSDPIFAAVGRLQFEVMQYRLKDEYGVETILSSLPYECSGWLVGPVETFKKPSTALMVTDRGGKVMVLFAENWEKQYAIRENPSHQLLDIA